MVTVGCKIRVEEKGHLYEAKVVVVVVVLPQRVFEEGPAEARMYTGSYDHSDDPAISLAGVWVCVVFYMGLWTRSASLRKFMASSGRVQR